MSKRAAAIIVQSIEMEKVSRCVTKKRKTFEGKRKFFSDFSGFKKSFFFLSINSAGASCVIVLDQFFFSTRAAFFYVTKFTQTNH